MVEAVRLVIWDLDETFWNGTITEGGIKSYVQSHHDVVMELARRGIMSSICSKNDEDVVRKVLIEHGIWDYFVMPSISWESKGPRLAAMIEAFQLRPSTVLFIDDNHGNRAEANAYVPKLQVSDEHAISTLLADNRFIGKDDHGLTRLAQYKLLETRKRDELQATGDNHDFLRGCNIRVHIEYDIRANLDRAIELVNRTNQLNFTKVRLSENILEARQELNSDLEDHFCQTGLVEVADKYGEYGYVGFFMLKAGSVDSENGSLTWKAKHFCFSCRTLGMLVERWLYDRLQRPKINIVGDVLTDLNSPQTIDWLHLVSSLTGDNQAIERLAPEIRVHGGCEANAIAHYLNRHSNLVVITGNFHAGTSFVRVNGASLLLSSCDRDTPEFAEETAALGIPHKMMVSGYFEGARVGTLFVIGLQADVINARRYRHLRSGWEVLIEPHGLGGTDLVGTTLDGLREKVEALDFSVEGKEQVLSTAVHVHDNYACVLIGTPATLRLSIDAVLERIPLGSRVLFVTDHDRVRVDAETVIDAPWARWHHETIADAVSSCHFASFVSFRDFVTEDSEIHVGGNHYDRMVYLRMAEAIVVAARALDVKRLPVSVHSFA